MSTAPAADPRRRRLILLGGVLLAALAVVLVLVLVSSGGGDAKEKPAASAAGGLPGAKETQALLKGIPQKGRALGSPKAPVTLVEFADLQCPFCQEYAQKVLPSLIRDYVRGGRLRMEFRPVVFLGPDSLTGARFVAAAGNQNHLWNALDLLYRNQGKENSGWLTEPLQRRAAASIPGVRASRLLADRATNGVRLQLVAADRYAKQKRIDSTPSFLVGRTGGKLRTLDFSDLTPAAFKTEIDPLVPGA
jgi:protein-disulfide isomerase